jgi:anaerobic magnesium-protoporphyrin IX monomethyl ester cyclase
MKVLFVEPPKDVWFVMGEYLPPPYGIIQLAAFLEKHGKNVEVEVLDCNAKHVDWQGLEKLLRQVRFPRVTLMLCAERLK